MKRCSLLNIFAVLGFVAKVAHTNELQNNCPAGYVLSSGLCYLSSQYPSTANCDKATTETAFTEQSTTYSSIDVPATTKPESIPDAIIKCPPGSIFMNGKCHEIICPHGEIIAGICLKIACPAGLVWRQHSCQEPEYLTTVLEIENVVHTEAHQSKGNVTRINTNNINKNVILNTTHTVTTTTTTTAPPVVVKPTTTTQRPPTSLTRPDCCSVHSPRLCKNYNGKWVCFNRRREFCDRKVCAFPTMYIRTPKIVFKEDLLIMPPHPPLKACRARGCDFASTIDCSGCVRSERENCSPYCYYYYCPEDTCGYMDLQDFCQIYPNHPFGCNQADGCIWGWCGGDNTQ